MSARLPVAAVAVAVAAACVAAVVPATPSSALVPHRIVAAQSRFIPGDIVIVEGDTLTFTNADLASHDLRSSDDWALFHSAIIGPGQSSDVTGVSSLSASTYPFVCALHVGMVGTLTVLPAP